MNRSFLVLALPLVLCRAALAQPDQQPGETVALPAAPQEAPGATPEGTVLKFAKDIATGDELGLSTAVLGARVGFYGPDEWNTLLRELPVFQALRAPNMKMQGIKTQKQTEDEATVVLSLGEEGMIGNPDDFTFQLRREKGGTPGFVMLKNQWRIVPPAVDEVLARPLAQTPPFQLAAVMALRDSRVLAAIQQQGGLKPRNLQDQALSQLKILGLVATQFALDYQEFYAFNDAARERALQPYLKTRSVFIIAGTKDAKWHFNDNLSTLALAQLNEPARTVLFYDGEAPESDQLNFRFDDKTLIGFADGHCKALSKDELKDVIWKH